MLLQQKHALILFSLLLVSSFNGCSYTGYQLGALIDSDRTVFHQASTLDSSKIAIVSLPTNTELNVHLKNGEQYLGTFEGTSLTRDSLSFLNTSGIRYIPIETIDYITKRNFRSATKIGLFLGIGVDVVIVFKVLGIIFARTYQPVF